MSDTYLLRQAAVSGSGFGPAEAGCRSGLDAAAKRALDVLGAGTLLLLTLPLMLLVALLVRRDGGPALYRHARIGMGDRPFDCLKFRSMVVDSQARLAALLATDPAARAEWEETRKLRQYGTRVCALVAAELLHLREDADLYEVALLIVAPRDKTPHVDGSCHPENVNLERLRDSLVE